MSYDMHNSTYEKRYDNIIKQCCEFNDVLTKGLIRGSVTPYEFIKSWKRIFCKACMLIGINKRSSKILFHDLAIGNWEHLHLSEEEKKLTSSDWIGNFKRDMMYSCDRWSMDRITRVHWQARQYVRAYAREHGENPLKYEI